MELLLGLQFKVGNGEFGDVYHLLATAYLLLQCQKEKIVIKFEKFPAGEELFRFFSVETEEHDPDPKFKPQHLSATANILLKHFYPGCLDSLAKKIIEAGRENRWCFPYPELTTTDPKLLIWQRGKEYKHHRNSSIKLLEQLIGLCARHNTAPVILGPRHELSGAKELGEFHKENPFFADDSIPKQLWFLDTLFRSYGAIANVGMMSGAMDGPTMLFGHKTVFLARHRDATPRMQKVSIAVPNLIWQQIEYEGCFQKLTDVQLQELEHNLWAN